MHYLSRDVLRRGVGTRLRAGLLVGALALLPAVAQAGEADDLQSMIDRSRQSTFDLERLDDRGTARDEVTLMRVWLDEAWRLRSESKYDETRTVLRRCDEQSEMIRQKIAAGKLDAEASAKESRLKQIRQEIEKTRQALHDAALKKAALEAKAK